MFIEPLRRLHSTFRYCFKSIVPSNRQFATPPWNETVLITPLRAVRRRWNTVIAHEHLSTGGIAALYQSNKQHYWWTAFGPAIVLPAFQRTHVGSHAIRLLLKYVLELPPSEVGFRKVIWAVSPNNVASNNLAKQMGFKLEGVFRWKYVLPAVEGYHKLGKEARAGDAGNGLLVGRDGNELALCWDDWEESAKELVERAFAREA